MTEIRLCLMSCCAPCSIGAMVQCANRTAGDTDISDFIVLFYNPNIYPEDEYRRRLAEQIRLCKLMGIKYAVGYPENEHAREHERWRECVRGLDDEPECGRRCAECLKMRIAWGACWARDHGYNALATVLGVSRHKDQGQVDDAARKACDKSVEVAYIPVQWDEALRTAEIKRHKLYRQKYCGCEFSMGKR